MACWVHCNSLEVPESSIDDLRAAWESIEDKNECEVTLEGPDRDYWLGSEIGMLGGYAFKGVTMGIDGSNGEGRMGAGCCCFKQPEVDRWVRVGREDEGTSSNRPELGGLLLALEATPEADDLLVACDNEAVLKVIRKWVGQGGKATLATAPDADILRDVLELLHNRIQAGAATFLVKVKSHRGEPINERADTLAEWGRNMQDKDKRWDQKTSRLIFQHGLCRQPGGTTWSASIRRMIRRQASQEKLSQAYRVAEVKWAEKVGYRKHEQLGLVWTHVGTTRPARGREITNDALRASLNRQVCFTEEEWAAVGEQEVTEHSFIRVGDAYFKPLRKGATREGRAAAHSGEFKSATAWGKSCATSLDEEQMGSPVTKTWSTDFLIRTGVSREEMGKWLSNRSIPWRRRRRLIQIATGTFPCGEWLASKGLKPSAGCELCKRARSNQADDDDTDLPKETIGHIQSAACAGQREVVTAAHHAVFGALTEDIAAHQEASRKVAILTLEREKTIRTLWDDAQCSQICTSEELWAAAKHAEMAIPLPQRLPGPQAEHDYESRFWNRRPDGIAIDTDNKTCYILEFKRTNDRRVTYRTVAEERARKQYESLVAGMQQAGQRNGWTTELLPFVGGTSGSVQQNLFKTQLEKLGVKKSEIERIRQRHARKLLDIQDNVLRSYFALKYDVGGAGQGTSRTRQPEHIGHDVYTTPHD